jgi:hypothetical protein
MKRLALVFILLALMVVSPALASTITGAKFTGIVTVSNNGTATASNSVVSVNISSANLIAGGYMNSSANNTVLRSSSGTDVPFMPGYGADWYFWHSSLSGLAQVNDILYTADSSGGALRYFPSAAGMTTADNNTSLELGSNFTIEQKGYIDTTAGASKYLYNKPGALTVAVSDTTSGNITATILGQSATLTPTGAGTYTQIPTLVGAATHWQAVLTDDAGTSYVQHNLNEEWVDTYTTNSAVPAGAIISNVSVTVKWRNTNVLANYGRMKTYVELNSANVSSAAHFSSTGYNGAWQTDTDNLTRPGGGSWTGADMASMRIGVSVYSAVAFEITRATYIYGTVTYTVPVTATGVSSGEHTIAVKLETR